MNPRHPSLLKLLALCIVLACQPLSARADQTVHYDIPAQPLDSALTQFGVQSGRQVIFDPDTLPSVAAPHIKGDYEPLKALGLLLNNTGLIYSIDSKDTIVVRQSGSAAANTPVRLTQADEPQSAQTQGSATAPARGAQESGISQIIVSARRREEKLKDVPLSIVTRTGKELEVARVDDLSQLDRVVPGYTYGGLSVTPLPSIYLRGIGAVTAGTGVDTSVGVAIDGVVTPRSSALAGGFSDIERIEVLRGPQGTLFGKNASAGLVSIVTRDPTATPSGNIGVGYGSYDEVTVKGTVSGPLMGDDLLGRLSVYYGERDGYITNVSGGEKLIDDRQLAARAKFLYRPFQDSQVRLTLYGVDRGNNAAQAVLPIRRFGPLSPAADRTNFGDIVTDDNTNTSVKYRIDGKMGYDTRTLGSTLQWDQQLGDYALTSITAYQDYSLEQPWVDVYSTPQPFPHNFKLYSENDTSQWSQEVRLASPADRRIDYVAGLYLYTLRYEAYLDQQSQATAVATPTYNNSATITDTLNYAGFGEANFKAADTLTFITGARWTHEKKDLRITALPAPAGYQAALLSLSPGESRGTVSATNISWRGGARWTPSEDRMFYLTASRGSKGPGFNTLAAFANQLQPAIQKIRPEIGTSYELGSKTTWLDRRLSADVAVFHSVFKDYQVTTLAPYTLPNGVDTTTYILSNAGKVRTQGVELQLQALPTDLLSVTLVGAYTDGKYLEYRNVSCYTGQTTLGTGCSTVVTPTGNQTTQDLSGTRLPIVPRFSGNLTVNHDVRLPGLPFDGFVNVNYSWRSEVLWSTTNAPFGTEDAYGLLGATLGVRSRDDRYEIDVYGKNLTDKFHVSGAGMGGGYGTITQFINPDYQRLWGATFRYNF